MIVPARALALLLVAAPLPAFAQDGEPAPSDAVTAASDGDAIDVATPTPPAEPLWTVAVSGGISARDDGPDGSWQSLSLSRRIGRGYLRGTLMRYHGTLLQADVALPSDYYVGTVGAGGNFDNWVVDGWASYGRQDYGRISTTSGSRSSTGAKGSDYYAIGGDFGRVVPLGGNFYLTPTVAASFANGRLLRPAPTDSGLTDLETGEPTWSANATMRVDHAFGPSGIHYAGLSISRNWTSNGVSALRLRRSQDESAAFSLDSKHYADGWFEAGAAASMKLGSGLYLDLFATRSFGVQAGNVTSAGATLRKSF
ncbi:autotransporter domain-containing protein [Novosphingobium sp. BL-52-GroH]|uniref:autotransporter domain-containing protein n=1 Tax=Novosphingobium sp. BL-52-GroH TaxID=3349877 RepID=UPI00384FE4AB